MKKVLCLFAFFLATAPSFAQNIEEVDSVYADSVSDMSYYLYEAMEAQRVTEICGVKFGTSYETAKRILENKYGDAEYDSSHSKQTIVFKNKKYAGIYFDSIHFLFQSDGYKTYMNGCIFAIHVNTVEEAKKMRDFLHQRLSEKYYMEKGIDDNGFKYYFGGISPLVNTSAFTIGIVKFSEIAKNITPYAARLYYGPYDYVKEEF